MTTKPTAPVDAVAAALGVELSDADRAAYQVQSPSAPAADAPPADDPPAQDPPAQDPPAAGTPPAQDPPADGAKPGDAPAALTPEAIAAALEGTPPADPNAGKTGVAELDEELPAEIQGRTRTRMEALIKRGRESHQQIQELTGQHAEMRPLAEQGLGWQRIVVQSGLAPEEFGAVMGTMAAINAGTVDQKRIALGKIRELYERVATELGEPLPGADPTAALAGFPDLQTRVANLELTAADALEIARARRGDTVRTTEAQRLEQENRRRQDYEAARSTAEAELNTLGKQLHERDGNGFLVRRHIAMKSVQNQVAQLHPSQWRQAFIDAYNATPQAVVDAALAQLGQRQAPAGTPTPRRQTPIMGRQGGGGGTGGGGGNGGSPNRAPATTLDAVSMALGIPTPQV